MATFPCTIEHGHCIIRNNGLVILIDLGSQVTIHITNSLDLFDQIFPVTTNYAQTNIPAIRGLTGINDLTTLLGTDILRQYKVLFDYANREISFGGDELLLSGTRVDLNSDTVALLIPVSLNGNTYPFVLDTGAVISYISPDLTTNLDVLDVREDFHPSFGRFQVECVNTTLFVGGVPVDGIYGIATSVVSMLLRPTHAKGILGYEFFRRFRVYLDLQLNLLVFI